MRIYMPLNRNPLFFVLLSGSMAVAGCGGGDNTVGDSSSQPEASASGETLDKQALRRKVRPEPAPTPTPTPDPIATPTGSARLAWTAAADARVVAYRVYHGSAPGSYLQAAGSGAYTQNTSGFTVSGLSSGKTYYFAVTAVTDVPGEESEFSNEAMKLIP